MWGALNRPLEVSPFVTLCDRRASITVISTPCNGQRSVPHNFVPFLIKRLHSVLVNFWEGLIVELPREIGCPGVAAHPRRVSPTPCGTSRRKSSSVRSEVVVAGS